MRIFKSLLASYYAVSNCKVSKKCWDIRFHDFGPNQAQIAYLPKKDIFGGIPFKIFDIAICLIIIQSLQKSREWIPRTKQVSKFLRKSKFLHSRLTIFYQLFRCPKAIFEPLQRDSLTLLDPKFTEDLETRLSSKAQLSISSVVPKFL